MAENLIQLITKFSTARYAFLFFLLFQPFLMLNNIYWSPTFLERYGVEVLDLSLGLEHHELVAILTTYGEVGRNHYLLFQLYDFFLPLFGALFIVTWLGYLLKRFFGDSYSVMRFSTLGFLPMLADWTENLGYLYQTLFFPNVSTTVSAITWYATHIKPGLLIGSMSILLIATIAIFIIRPNKQ